MGLLVAVARTQELPNCTTDTSPFSVGSTEDATTLAASLGCMNGDFVVQWLGEVVVAEAIRVRNGTSLNITGTGGGAIADGRGTNQLFSVEGGASLHLSDMTLTSGSAPGSSGGAIYASQSSISFSSNISFIFNSAGESGGAIFASESTVFWGGDNTTFRSNSAGEFGGAICLSESTLSWRGDGTTFSSNSAELYSGGAIYARDESTVYWDGDGTKFSNNYADVSGGAIFATGGSNLSWTGDGTKFLFNNASDGGAMTVMQSFMSWDGDSTEFRSNNAHGGNGGAIAVTGSTGSWDGDGTGFVFNTASIDGGAISVFTSTVSWDGNDTIFDSNIAAGNGGAIRGEGTANVVWNGRPTFTGNVAEGNGGALSLTEFGEQFTKTVFAAATFVENSAENGGAVYVYNSVYGFDFTDIVFRSNSAEAGGAFAAFAGTEDQPITFLGCMFSDNKVNGAGGAVETLSGQQEFFSCVFEGNSAGEETGKCWRSFVWKSQGVQMKV